MLRRASRLAARNMTQIHDTVVATTDKASLENPARRLLTSRSSTAMLAHIAATAAAGSGDSFDPSSITRDFSHACSRTLLLDEAPPRDWPFCPPSCDLSKDLLPASPAAAAAATAAASTITAALATRFASASACRASSSFRALSKATVRSEIVACFPFPGWALTAVPRPLPLGEGDFVCWRETLWP